MNEYPDTSFLCAAYRIQVNHLEAAAYRKAMTVPLPFTSLLEFEFLQGARFQAFIHASDRTKGFSQQQADKLLGDWEYDVATGLNKQVAYDAEAVNKLARRFTHLHTLHGGHRSFDILHVATAVHLGSKIFLTFDARQKALAKVAGLKVPFK